MAIPVCRIALSPSPSDRKNEPSELQAQVTSPVSGWEGTKEEEGKGGRRRSYTVSSVSARGVQVGRVLISGRGGKPIALRDAPLPNFQSSGRAMQSYVTEQPSSTIRASHADDSNFGTWLRGFQARIELYR